MALEGLLEDRVAVVTGGATGIGMAISASLAGAGAQVVVASRSQAKAASHARAIEAGGGRATATQLELADSESIRLLVNGIVQQYGRLDILVHSAVARMATYDFGFLRAGVADTEAAMSATVDAWTRANAANTTGPFALTLRALPAMREQGRGAIIFIGSIFGQRIPDTSLYESQKPERFRPDYYFAKAGLTNLMRYFAVTQAPVGIRVNCVSPGPVSGGARSARELAALSARIPLGRLVEASEVASVVTFLASDVASMITGQNIVVDGGYTCV